ncbi:MAG: Calx-beta domain-containing protein [Chloroflexota bacterium]
MTDDDTSSIAVDDVSVAEGNAGSTNATFTVSLEHAQQPTVTVQAQTANGAGATAATSGSDYTAVNVTVTFNAGETSKPWWCRWATPRTSRTRRSRSTSHRL